jgi:DNA (cytosine-5)-methyltransferase 1
MSQQLRLFGKPSRRVAPLDDRRDDVRSSWRPAEPDVLGSQVPEPLEFASLFAGIGGFELGLARAGHESTVLVENYEPARAVLRARFSNVELLGDVRAVDQLPSEVQGLAAGFPCQDLSSVGQKLGINGARSRLVGEVFRLLEHKQVEWVILENVPFLLQLGRGRALRLITTALDELGYRWAYRVIDTRAFGLPQRRRRWYLVASLTADPCDVLLADDADPLPDPPHTEVACGFYWTEGMRALGWAIDSVPPIKGGSTVGVPSPPAIRLPTGDLVTPDLRDAERLQGFPAEWTSPAEEVARPGFRWQLVGNAVSTPVTEWIGRRLRKPLQYDPRGDEPLGPDEPWPYAAWSDGTGTIYRSAVSVWPTWLDRPHLVDFLEYEPKPLSARAAAGFLARTRKGSLRFPDGFIAQVQDHINRQLRFAA